MLFAAFAGELPEGAKIEYWHVFPTFAGEMTSNIPFGYNYNDD